MKPAEKIQVLVDLESGRKSLLDALNGVTDEIARRSPGPGKWSILECVEHVAVAEDFLFR
jgi:hypothetical protein